jgi:putative hydrolase of the HAD superfamily
MEFARPPLPASVEVLLFDLGGVLYGIDVARSVEAFRSLMPESGAFPDAGNILQHPIFRQFELGHLSLAGFRDALRHTFGLRGSDADLDAAWNALLLGPIAGRAALLKRLRQHFRLVLLSNTNVLHYESLFAPSQTMLENFDQIYLSYEMGMRKPDLNIFQAVLDSESVNPGQVYFIEDSAPNLMAAKSLGIQGLLVPMNCPKLPIIEQ